MTGTNIIAGEMPAEVLQANQSMLEQFRAQDPSLQGQIQPEESVRKSLKVIEDLDSEKSGSFVSHNGDRVNWF
jgi:hypothetical protein